MTKVARKLHTVSVKRPARLDDLLEAGTRLEIRAREGRLELEPSTTPMRLVRRGRGLVATTDEPLPRLDADTIRTVLEAQRR